MSRLAYSAFFLLPLSSLIMLAGCDSFFPPGYTNEHKEYKAPKGPRAGSIGYPYKASANDGSVKQWRPITARLVQQLHDELGIMPQKVFVKMLPDQSVFNATFDYSLREELRRQGYILVQAEKNVLTVEPEALEPVHMVSKDSVTTYNNDDDQSEASKLVKTKSWFKNIDGKFLMGLIATHNGELIGEVKGEFTAPYYGYAGGGSIDRLSHLENDAPVLDRYDAPPKAAAPESADAPQNLLVTPAVPGDVKQEPLDAR